MFEKKSKKINGLYLNIINDIDKGERQKQGNRAYRIIGLLSHYLYEDASKAFNELIDLLFEEDYISNNYSKSEIISKISEIISRDINENEFVTTFKDYIENGREYISEEKFVVFGLNNIKVVKENFGDICLYDKQNLIREYPKFKKELDNLITNSDAYAVISVKGSNKKAFQFADEKLLNLIYGISFIFNYYREDHEINSVNFSSRCDVEYKDYIIFSAKKCSIGWTATEHGINFPKGFLHEIIKYEDFSNIKDIISNNHKTPLEKKINDSIIWHGKSIYEGHQEHKIILMCIACEILFSGSTNITWLTAGSISDKISSAMAFLTAEDLETRKQIAKLVKKIYDIRSRIVHGTEYSINKDDLRNFQLLTIRAILNTSKLTDQLNNLEELREYVNDKKFS